MRLTKVTVFATPGMAATLMLASVLPASAVMRMIGGPSNSADLQMRAFRDPLVQQIISTERLHPRDTALCNKASILPLFTTGLIFVPYPCNGWVVLTSYAPPTYGGNAATTSYVEFIESSGTPTSAVTNQSLYSVSFPSAPTDTTPQVYLESIGVSPYPNITFTGPPPARYAPFNLIVSTSITKGATYEILGYRWDPVGLQYVAGYSSGPFTSKYGTLAYFPGLLQNGQVIPQLTRLYFILYACANASCT